MLGSDVRNIVGVGEPFGSGDRLHRACSRAFAGDNNGDCTVGGRREQERHGDDYGCAATTGWDWRESHGGFGADEPNAEPQRDGAERSVEQGRYVDADGGGMRGSNVRNAIECIQCFRSGDCLYRARSIAFTGDSNGDCAVRRRREQERGDDDYGCTAATGGDWRESDGCVGANEPNTESQRYGAE